LREPSSEIVSVVVHVDDASANHQRLALGNVANLLDDLGAEDSMIEVVFNGPSISALILGSKWAPEVAELTARGVGFVACSNSMTAARISSSDLIPGVTVVPSGISHLVRRQREGWAYVRP